MSVFSNVVVGLDGSLTAEHALRWAADRLGHQAQLHVVHAGAPDPTVPTGIEVTSIQSRDAEPATALLDAARDIGADAIVVGPHGSGLGIGMGSVTKRLLREAAIPVVVIDGLEPPRSEEQTAPVVACVGYGEPADAAAAWAAEYAVAHELPLVLLHSVSYRPVFPIDAASDVLASYLGAGVSASWALDEMTSLAKQLNEQHPELRITAHVETTSVVKAVQHAGEFAELVVLGKRSDEEFLHTIGTPRLRRLVARSKFPTAVIPCDAVVQ